MVAKKSIEKYMVVVTGLHIGGSSEYEIGSIDNVVVKDPWGYPYVPGSSLKGKMRSLLEKQKGKNEVCKCGTCEICKTFGYTNGEKASVGMAIFRDAFVAKALSDESVEMIKKDLPFIHELKTLDSIDTPFDLLEVKFENTIDRITGRTISGGLRQTERVVPGTVFKVQILYDESSEEVLQTLEKGIELLQEDYLGGSGTRGYGAVKFYEV